MGCLRLVAMAKPMAVGMMLILAATAMQAKEAVPNLGMAMRADVKYGANASHFEYANPNAPKGGAVVLGMEGNFDSLNPFALKGTAPFEVNTLVFQELGERSLDEPFSKYPAIAESFVVADDKLSMTIKLRKEAKFSDGKPITAEDVVFSFKLFQSDAVAPLFKVYWADIADVKAKTSDMVVMRFKQVNPELPLIALELPVLPKHVYGKGDFGKDFADQAIGSGPYIIKNFKRGSSITFKRNPNFWGADHFLYKGRFNFDEVTLKYYKDPTAQVEAFKKGDFDFYSVNSSKVWALDLEGERFDKLKWIKKEEWPHSNNQGTQGFLFNLRSPLFADVRVRQAIALAFDFDWSNKNLFYGQYIESQSFFENSTFKAIGLPSAEELAVLEPLKKDLPAEVFTKEVGWLGKGQGIRTRLRTAVQLLKDAGYNIKDGVATGPAGRLEFKFMMAGPGFQRVVEPYAQNLKKLGVIVSIDQKEASLYIKHVENRDFQMIVQRIGQSQSPGNEQRDYWTTSAAEQNYSRNYAGLKNKAVDSLVEKVIYAQSRQELELMVRCLDRVLYHQHLLVPNWHSPTYRVAYWDRFAKPQALPQFYSVQQLLEFMWYDADKAAKLSAAQVKGAAME